MSTIIRLRDVLRRFTLPRWLKAPVAFKYMWSMVAVLDVGRQMMLEGIRLAWPGVGSPSALPYIGRTRGITRGFGTSETDESFIGRLRGWFAAWVLAGSQLGLALALHYFLSNRPRVTIVSRGGMWTSVNADGSIARERAAWDWDSVSNPERAGFWSEMWIIVYPDPWSHRGGTVGDGTPGGESTGWGHLCSREEYDAVKSLIQTWKSAHSRVRAVIFTTDSTLFTPSDDASLPNGNWGEWGVGDPMVRSDRNVTTCRYWEPN